MNSLCEPLMVFIPAESVVVDKTAGDSLKKYTLRLMSVTCADDVVIAMFADMTVSGCILFPDIVGNTDSTAMLEGAMANPSMST